MLSAKWWKSPDVRNPSQFYWQSNILLEFLKYEAKSTFTNWDFWLVTELNISVLMRQLGLFLSHLSFIEIQQKQKFPFVKSKSQQTLTKKFYVYHISYPFFWNQGLHNWSIAAMANELSSLLPIATPIYCQKACYVLISHSDGYNCHTLSCANIWIKFTVTCNLHIA